MNLEPMWAALERTIEAGASEAAAAWAAWSASEAAARTEQPIAHITRAIEQENENE